MSTTDDTDRMKLVGDYKHGSIRRVKMRNFLTYFDAEVTPGPRLNMVIGPNGTGKSTILCAICLGLGGEPRLLGRASDIETFVANGEEEGEIEIELANTKGGDNPVIRRVIRRSGSPKSVFYWDGKQIPGKTVKESCLKNYDISVDNLCTFLPQDRVGSFSGFDSKQLLIETEKALSASQDLYHTHQQMIKDQEEMRGENTQRETLEDKLRQLEHENSRLGRAKELMEERDEAEAQVDLLQKKMLWLEFDQLVEESNVKKATKKELKAKIVELQQNLKPLEEQNLEVEENINKLKGVYSKCEAEIRSAQNEMDKQSKKYETHDTRIEEIIQEIQSIETRRRNKERKVEEYRERLKKQENLLKEYPSLQSLQEEELQCRNDYKAVGPECDSVKREHARLVQECRDLEDEHKQVAAKVAKLQNEKARRKERIFRQQPDLGKISDWLNQNRSRFRKDVVGPVMCEIALKDATTAAYLEQHVPNHALKCFVVRCQEDYDLLYHCIREEQNIPINIATVREIKPITNRLYSDQKVSILKKQHGVTGYLDECIDAPAVVLQSLMNAAQIEKVLVGTDKTQDSLDNQGLLDYLSEPERAGDRLQSCAIFSSKGNNAFKYTSIISKYSGKPSVRIDTIRPAKWLAPGVSEDLKNQVAADLRRLEDRLNEIRPAMEQAIVALTEANARAQEAKAKMNKSREMISDARKMENRIRNAQAKLREAEKELEVDDEEEGSKHISDLEKRVNHSLMALEAQARSYDKMMNATVKSAGARLNLEAATVESQKLSFILQEKREDLETMVVEYRNLEAEYKRGISELKRLQAKAKKEAPLEDDNGEPTPLHAKLEALGVDNYAEAAAALEEAQGKVDSIVADNNAIREWERNAAELEDVRAQLDDLSSFEERRREELDAKVKPWEQRISQAVSKIDVLFSKYMSEMGCTGEIGLTKGESSEDMPYGNFKDWGIEIRVSFRENHKLQVLSARVQSGGERSVSTIMYLMALQGLMVSPFRCVDEINQGLDERNERLVFKRIVTNSTIPPGKEGRTDHAGQYFLITPKLLPNLYDMEVEAMTVLFIFNGPYNVRSPTDFDIARLLSLRKRAITKTEAAEDDENTPNSQNSNNRPRKQARRSSKSIEGSSEDV